MGTTRRSLAVAFTLALACTLIPASITPAGTIEMNGLCATADCESKAGAVCVSSGELLWDHKVVVR